MHEGFYRNGEQKPFNEEALADYFAALTPGQLCRHQLQMARYLQRELPELFTEGIFALDCCDVRVPAGHFQRPVGAVGTRGGVAATGGRLAAESSRQLLMAHWATR
jgi:hypothetical protein